MTNGTTPQRDTLSDFIKAFNEKYSKPKEEKAPDTQQTTKQPAYRRSDLQGKNHGAPVWLLLLQIFTALLTIWLIWQSVEVYVSIGQMIGQSWITDATPNWAPWISKGLIGWVLTPIRWLLEGGSILISVGGMVVLYITLQIFEIAPLLLENSPRALQRIIEAIGRQKRLELKTNDLPIVMRLKEQHNAIPQKWVRSIYTAKWVAYLVDLLICLYACPPIRGGWNRLELVMAAPTMSDFDIGNIWKTLVTLFAVECGFFVYMWIRHGKRLFAGTQQETLNV